MDPAFDSAAFGLPLKTVSRPVLSQFGFHLIEITSRKGNKAKGRHILFPIEVEGDRRRLDRFPRRPLPEHVISECTMHALAVARQDLGVGDLGEERMTNGECFALRARLECHHAGVDRFSDRFGVFRSTYGRESRSEPCFANALIFAS